MKTSLKTLFAAAAFGVSALFASAQTAPKIAIIDLAKVFDGHYRTQEQQEKLKGQEAKINEEISKIVKDGQALAEKYKVHWMEEREETGGPGPRYYCVKDLLRRLGNEKNYELHDALFEFVYLQHKHFIHYFNVLLDPVDAASPPAEGPKPVADAPPA